MRGAGGTPGGLGTFLSGAALVVAGGYLLLTRVMVTAGWVLTSAGMLIIVLGVVANLGIHFRPTTLFDTLLILGLLAAGLGLVARSLRAQGPPEAAGGS